MPQGECLVSTKIRLLFQQLKNATLTFVRERLVFNLAAHSKEEYELNFNDHFSKAKALSDFIGMIVRYSFANFAAAYFLKRANESDGIRGAALSFCSIFTLGLTIAIGARIYILVVLYQASDVHRSTHKVAKVAKVLITLL